MGFERELNELERLIERLNHEYGAFLYGAAARAPVESRRQVDVLLRRLNAADIEAAAERYRLATLQGHYNALAERWERQQAEKEDGRRPGFYATISGAVRPTGSGPRWSASVPARGPDGAPAGSVQKEGSAGLEPGRELFERYVGAKRALGEDVSGYDYGQFMENLERERVKIREKTGTEDFEFDVKDSDGRVRLVARRRKISEGR